MTFEDIWQGLRELVPSFITALPVAIVIILGGVLINLVASRALGAGWLTFLDSGHRIIYAIRDGLTAELTLTLTPIYHEYWPTRHPLARSLGTLPCLAPPSQLPRPPRRYAT